MSLGDRIEFASGSYEVRAMVDGRYVVRLRDRVWNREVYRVWTEEERTEFDHTRKARVDTADRNAQIYERRLSGETLADLGRDFALSPSRIRVICANQARKERRPQA